MQRRTRLSLVGVLAAGVMTALAGPAAVSPTAAPSPAPPPALSSATAVSAGLLGAPEAAEGEAPAALSRHLEELHSAVPGQGGEPEEGPGSAAEAAFRMRAYPADTISVSQAQTAATSFQQARNLAASRSTTAADARWRPYGPSQALYPFTPLRNSTNYVPNKYVAGGRTTSVAIAPTCNPGKCRMYVTPAGGGVWRTKNALSASRSGTTSPAASASTRWARSTSTPATPPG